MLLNALLAFFLTWLTYQLAQGDLDRRDKIASVVSLFVALLGLGLAVYRPAAAWLRGDHDENAPSGVPEDQLSKAVDRLAVLARESWRDEAGRRGLSDSVPINLRWRGLSRSISAHASSIAADTVGGNPIRIRLSGQLAEAADKFNRLPRRRLVILGTAGAGKTSLAILMMIGLIERRKQGHSVPVLVPVAAWNPRQEKLRDWIAREVAEEYYAGRTEIPREMLRLNLLLPILDGLDEMPSNLRADAIRQIGRALDDATPVIVTSRTEEYEEAVRGANGVLNSAAVVELEAVRAPDAIAFFAASSQNNGIDALIGRLQEDPGGPLATALSTPLMVSLAQAVQRSKVDGGDLHDLLDGATFHEPAAIEQWLLDALIPAAYSVEPEGGGMVPSDAKRYLSSLARHLAQSQTTLIAWWQLHRAVHPAATGLTYWTIGWACALLGIVPVYGFPDSWAPALGVGALIGIVAATARAPDPARTDWNLRARLPGSFRRLVRGVVIGTIFGFVAGLTFGIDSGVAYVLSTEPVVQNWVVNGPWLTVSLAIAAYFGVITGSLSLLTTSLVAGLARGVREGLFFATRISAGISAFLTAAFFLSATRSADSRRDMLEVIGDQRDTTPYYPAAVKRLAEFFADDRLRDAAAIEAFLMFFPEAVFVGIVLGLAFGICTAFRDATGLALDVAEAATPDAVWRLDLRATLVRFIVVTIALSATIMAAGAIRTAAVPPLQEPLFLGAAVGAVTASFSASARFCVSNLALWVAGRMPMNGMFFLRDARERGLLRQVGASYQFRHGLLQVRLSEHGDRSR